MTKVQEIGSNQEDSIALSSNSQRRSQRAIKRKKFDDEVVSTEPGVISATAAAAAASTVTNMETTTHELDTKEVLFKQFIHLALLVLLQPLDIYNSIVLRQHNLYFRIRKKHCSYQAR